MDAPDQSTPGPSPVAADAPSLTAALTAPPLLCASCNYPLANIPEDSRCPECGLSVAATRRGPLLRHADADWRSQLHTGSIFLVIAPAIGLALFVVLMLYSAIGMLIGANPTALDSADWVFSLALMIASALLARGWWLMTHDEPDAPLSTGSHALNLALRITSIAFFAVLGLVWLVESALNWLGAGATAMILVSASLVPLGLIGLTHLIGAMLFFSRLAARIPSARMAKEFRRSAWLLGIAGLVEGVHQATGWRPSPRPGAGTGIPALLALPLVLLNLVLSVAALAAPLWYAISALWVWRKLRAIEASAPRRVQPDDEHEIHRADTARDPRDESSNDTANSLHNEGTGLSSPADGG